MASAENKEVAAIEAAEERPGVVDGAVDDFGGPEDQGGSVSPDCLIGPCGLDGPGSPGGHSNQGAPGPLNDQGLAEAHDDQGGLDASGDQGGADAHDHEGGLGVQNDQGGAGVLDHQEGYGALYDHGGNQGVLQHEVLERAEFAWADCVSGPGGDAGSEVEGQGDRCIILTVSVPFESHLEAEMVHLAMDIEIPTHHQAVQNEFRLYGSVLVITWIAEEPGPLQDSVNMFFELLSLLL